MTSFGNLETIVCNNSQNFPSLAKLDFQDVSSIWLAMSLHIRDMMLQKKGIIIPGLGTFAFSMKNIFVGQKEAIEIHKPVFLLSEKLATSFGLQIQKNYISGSVPVVNLNFSSLAQQVGKNRDIVMGCIKEVILSLTRVMAKGESFVISFPDVCSLCVKNKKVHTSFFATFLSQLGISDECKSRLFSPFPINLQSSEYSRTRSTSQYSRLNLPRLSISPASCSNSKMFGNFERNTCASKLSNAVHENIVIDSDVSRNRSKSAPSELIQQDIANRVTSSHNKDELCHCCMDRSARNATPVIPNLENKISEEERQLLKFQQEQDASAIAQDLMILAKRRNENKEISHLNWHTALVQKDENKKSSLLTPDSACLFHLRPATQSRYIKQHEYWSNLVQQVRDNFDVTNSARKDKCSQEKRDQQLLALELAKDRELYYKKKAINSKLYHNALNYQIEQKNTLDLNEAKDNFLKGEGVDLLEMEMKREQEKRKIAKQVYQEQLEAAEQQKVECLTQRMSEREEEAIHLKANRIKLLHDRESCFNERNEKYNSLVSSWNQNIAEKKVKSDFEKVEEMKESIYLLDQVSSRRCKQCQRYSNNKGASNVLRDTRYISGSRYMA